MLWERCQMHLGGGQAVCQYMVFLIMLKINLHQLLFCVMLKGSCEIQPRRYDVFCIAPGPDVPSLGILRVGNLKVIGFS